MIFSKFLRGLEVLKPHYKKDGHHIGAEHDQFYAYATDTPLTHSEFEEMLTLGWFQPDVYDEGAGGSAPYDASEGWSAYT